LSREEKFVKDAKTWSKPKGEGASGGDWRSAVTDTERTGGKPGRVELREKGRKIRPRKTLTLQGTALNEDKNNSQLVKERGKKHCLWYERQWWSNGKSGVAPLKCIGLGRPRTGGETSLESGRESAWE